MALLQRIERSRACRCGHQPDAHLHYRPGHECGLCECAQWSQCGGPRFALALWRPGDPVDIFNQRRPLSQRVQHES